MLHRPVETAAQPAFSLTIKKVRFVAEANFYALGICPAIYEVVIK